MKKGKVKKMLVMVLISILVTVVFVNIYGYATKGYLESDWKDFSTAVKLNCKGESAWDYIDDKLVDTNSDFIVKKQEEIEGAKENLSRKYNTNENLDAIYLMEYLTIEDDIAQVSQMQDKITDNIIAIVVGVVLGVVAFYITEIKVKYNWIKLIIGYLITGILSFLVALIFPAILNSRTNLYITIDEIKKMFEYHSVEFIGITTIMYIVLILTNYLVQKRKVVLLNNELKNK